MRYMMLSALIALLIDQASKYGVVWGLGLIDHGYIAVFPPYLTFVMAWNTGVNFGLFDMGVTPMRWILITLSLGICAALLFWLRQSPQTRIVPYLSTGLIIGGAIGNVIDRVIQGAVIDFLNMSCCGIQNPYAFNLADVFIFIGAFGLILFTDAKRHDIET